jgi:hypothetical protein
MVFYYENINILTFRWEIQHGPPLRGYQCSYFQMEGPAWSFIMKTSMFSLSDERSNIVLILQGHQCPHF